ncbi:transmembrane protein 196-like [Anneissia japonica]|uniref:transmembrane protein 196-like n=1 Tax=Anneissia japonica TaxID=1529436 RepID=UPI00142589E4|nr:transmembrane protein 196-like [Anneissia japonica]XP_033113095.1 transmembrane protein 196-like [Anneissia japonica]XP_033113096.1 transmembrane protein 196-like [Anneissia japonica]
MCLSAILGIFAFLHLTLGLLSFTVGCISSSQAIVWLAHTVSPIWSGVCFIVCGVLGFVSVRKQTPYTVLCFTAFSVVSIIIGIINIQLLRLGLVDHTTDGETFMKKDKDILVVIALITACTECGISLISAFVSCGIARHIKKQTLGKNEHILSNEERIAERQEQIRKQKQQERKAAAKERGRSVRYKPV